MCAFKAVYDITELARAADVSSRTIRYYEERGLIAPLERKRGHRRQYGPDALERLRFIARLKNLGLTLGEIGELNRSFERGQTPAMLENLESLLSTHLKQISTRIKELQQLETELTSYLERIRGRKQQAAGEEGSED